MFKINPLTATDFYKVDHRSQYPKGTTLVYSNLTPRSDKLNPCKASPFYDGKLVFFGLQDFIKTFLIDIFNDNFFKLPKDEVINIYKRRIETSLGKNVITYEHIEALHNLGYLPILIKALPEGSQVNMKIPVLTIVNTHPDFYWLVNFLETIMSAELWKMSTNATIAYEYKKIMMHYANKTGSDLSFIPFQGHDFSFRGMSGYDDASKCGMAHLTSFIGTDTIPAIDRVEYSYTVNANDTLIGCSVPATEHSVMCLNSKESEIDTYKRLISEIYPDGIVSIVSDTWDYWKVITEYLPKLKDAIMTRDGKVVIRPDSGDPIEIICGFIPTEYRNAYGGNMCDSIAIDMLNNPSKYTYFDKKTNKYCRINKIDGRERHEYQYDICETQEDALLSLSQVKGTIECLWNIFGGTINDKGYKVLDPHIGVIYGDSITIEKANIILERLEEKGFASSNIVFGIGSYTYQYSTRDSFGFAVKSTYGEVNGESRDIFKDPITDSGIKKSAKGLLCVLKDSNDEFILNDQCTKEQETLGELQTVFKNSELIIETSLTEIRERLNNVKN